MKNFALKGTILYSQSPDKLAVLPRGYAVCQDGVCRGVYPALPEKYQTFEVKDWGDCLILQGFCDLHLHGPQYPMVGMGMDLPLLLLPVGFVYLCEIGSVVLQVTYFKATHGKRLFKMSPIHHHFEMCGWSEVKICLVFGLVALLGGAVALACVLFGL